MVSGQNTEDENKMKNLTITIGKDEIQKTLTEQTYKHV